jgi:hypothetical protein
MSIVVCLQNLLSKRWRHTTIEALRLTTMRASDILLEDMLLLKTCYYWVHVRCDVCCVLPSVCVCVCIYIYIIYIIYIYSHIYTYIFVVCASAGLRVRQNQLRDICWRMLTGAYGCASASIRPMQHTLRMLTDAQALGSESDKTNSEIYADVCWRMLTDAYGCAGAGLRSGPNQVRDGSVVHAIP